MCYCICVDRLVDKVRYQKSKSDKDDDLASDGVITDMAYCPERSFTFLLLFVHLFHIVVVLLEMSLHTHQLTNLFTFGSLQRQEVR